LTNLSEGDILFIDEIHRLNRNIEEILYPAMEDFAIDLILGKGPSARTMRIDLPHFTLVGATTKIGALSSPLRDRFGAIHRLEFYTEKELADIIKRAANILNVKIDPSGVDEISKRSRRTPRIANRILKRVRDFAEVKHDGVITEKIAQKALEQMEIDQLALTETTANILQLLLINFPEARLDSTPSVPRLPKTEIRLKTWSNHIYCNWFHRPDQTWSSRNRSSLQTFR